jgi:epoxyqueuosine reductase QueG
MRRPSGAGADEAWIDLLDVLAADNSSLMDRLGRWYIANRDPDYVRRNALLVLANVADGTDPAVRAAVEQYLDSPNPMLRAHAVWTARRLDIALPHQVMADPDALVAIEVARP